MNASDYLVAIWNELQGVYDKTMPMMMPYTLRGHERAQSQIREARHAIHEAMCHIGDAAVLMHKVEVLRDTPKEEKES